MKMKKHITINEKYRYLSIVMNLICNNFILYLLHVKVYNPAFRLYKRTLI